MIHHLRVFATRLEKNWTDIIGNFNTSILKQKRTWNIIFLLVAVSLGTMMLLDNVFNVRFIFGDTTLAWIILNVTAVPLVEEIMWRGAVLGPLLWLLDKWKIENPLKFTRKKYYAVLAFGIFAQAWVFSIAHQRMLLATTCIFVDGILLGFAYWHFKKNLWPPIILHSLFNLYALLLLPLK